MSDTVIVELPRWVAEKQAARAWEFRSEWPGTPGLRVWDGAAACRSALTTEGERP